jgi:uncharacterized protein YbdZ (MbtH family)
MNRNESGDNAFRVVRSGEEQYAALASGSVVPTGWVDTGISGTESVCLEYIRSISVLPTPSWMRRQLTPK